MNTERLTKIAQWLEAGGDDGIRVFDMPRGLSLDIAQEIHASEVEDCGTVCCIAGAAVAFFSPGFIADYFSSNSYISPGDSEVWWDGVKMTAKGLLGISDDDAQALFTPASGNSLAYYSDPAWASRVIRKYIKTGVVDWCGCKAQ